MTDEERDEINTTLAFSCDQGQITAQDRDRLRASLDRLRAIDRPREYGLYVADNGWGKGPSGDTLLNPSIIAIVVAPTESLALDYARASFADDRKKRLCDWGQSLHPEGGWKNDKRWQALRDWYDGFDHLEADDVREVARVGELGAVAMYQID